MLTDNCNNDEKSKQSSDQIALRHNTKYQPFLVAIILTLLFFSVDILALPPFYETNDDVGMSMIVAGFGFAAKPDEHILFSHIFIGQLLSALYALNNHFPWYGTYLIACHFLSFSVISALLVEKLGVKAGIFSALILGFSIELYTLSNLQFTTTAFMLSAAGGLLGASWLLSEKNMSTPRFWGSMLLLIAASMVRFQMFGLSLLFIAISVGPAIFQSQNKLKTAGKACLLLGLSAFFSLVLVQVNNKYYENDPGWKDFYSNSANNGVIRDYERPVDSSQAKAALQNVGWSLNDVEALRGFLNCNESIFSPEKTRYVATHLPAYRSDLSIAATFDILASCFKDYFLWPFLAAIFLLLALRRRDIPFAYYAAVLAASLILALSMIVFLKLPARIYVCITSFVLLTFSFTLDPRNFDMKLPSSLASKNVLLVGILSLLVPFLSLAANVPRTAAMKVHNKNLKTTIKYLNPKANHLYIVWGGAFPYEAIKPLDDFHAFFDNFKLLSLSCQNGTQLIRDRLKEFGINDLYKSLLMRNDEIFMIVQQGYPTSVLDRYYEEHYTTRIAYEKVEIPIFRGLNVVKLNAIDGNAK